MRGDVGEGGVAVNCEKNTIFPEHPVVAHKMSIIVIMIIHVVFIMSAFYPSIIGDGIFVFLIAILFKGVILFLN